MKNPILAILGLTVALAGCSSDAGSNPDAGPHDAVSLDAGLAADAQPSFDAQPQCLTGDSPPESLGCCSGAERAQPTCINDAWQCAPGSTLLSSLDATCGMSQNVAEEGVVCGTSQLLCEPETVCCNAIATTCTLPDQGSCYATSSCDGPEDCPADTVCCGFPGFGIYHSAECRSSCEEPDTFIACNTEDDCPSSLQCCQETTTLATGACAAQCY